MVSSGADGAGVVTYARGGLRTTVDAPFETTHHATARAIGQLEFARISDQKDALSAVLIARTAQDRKIRIVLTRVSDRLTQVDIRVGVMGDETMSRTILGRIQENF